MERQGYPKQNVLLHGSQLPSDLALANLLNVKGGRLFPAFGEA